MGFRTVLPSDRMWRKRPHGPGEPPRHVAELSDELELQGVRANVWRYEPGAAGKRHVHDVQSETFVVLEGTLTMLVGEPAEEVVVPPGGVLHVDAGTPLQSLNRGTTDLLVYVHGSPPDHGARVLDSAVRR